MRGITLAAVAFVAAILLLAPAAEASGCQPGGGGGVFSFTAPQQHFVQQQAFVAPVYQRQAFVTAPFVRHRGLNVVAPGVRLNVGAQRQVQFRRRIPPFNLLLGPRPVFR